MAPASPPLQYSRVHAIAAPKRTIEHDSAPQQQRLGFQRMPRARGERQLKCE
ncbi:hypothetical protein ARSEF1564_000627 [Beauveria bassiana]